MPNRLAAALLIMLATALPAAAGQLKMQPGLWEDVIATPDGALHTEQKCYLQRDIDNIDRFQRGLLNTPAEACKATGYKTEGDAVSYTLTCTRDKERSVSQVMATYHGTEVTGTMDRDGNVTRLTRRRIGNCTKSSLTP